MCPNKNPEYDNFKCPECSSSLTRLWAWDESGINLVGTWKCNCKPSDAILCKAERYKRSMQYVVDGKVSEAIKKYKKGRRISKMYFIISILVAIVEFFFLIWIGDLAFSMISDPSTFGVAVGILILLLILGAVLIQIRWVIKKFGWYQKLIGLFSKNKEKEKEEQK